MIIKIERLCKQYGSLQAVKDLNLGIRAGEVYGFLGPNGAGKTTTILMILGMLQPSSGKVTIFGEEVKGLETQLRARIGVVPEHQSLYDDMTGGEYLDFFCNLHGIADSKARIGELLEYFDLFSHRNTRLGEYSHGMRQKINISRGLIHDPDLLILDEPVLGLDPASVRLVRDLILSEKKRGKTALISSHLLSEIEKTVDRVGIMSEGELVMEGSIEKVIAAIGGENVLDIELEQIPPTVIEELQCLPTVLNVSGQGNRLLIQVESLEGARSLVSRVITGNGGTIINFGTRSPDLEDAFLAITQGHIDRLREEI